MGAPQLQADPIQNNLVFEERCLVQLLILSTHTARRVRQRHPLVTTDSHKEEDGNWVRCCWCEGDGPDLHVVCNLVVFAQTPSHWGLWTDSTRPGHPSRLLLHAQRSDYRHTSFKPRRQAHYSIGTPGIH